LPVEAGSNGAWIKRIKAGQKDGLSYENKSANNAFLQTDAAELGKDLPGEYPGPDQCTDAADAIMAMSVFFMNVANR
jgi:hypothetical protein